MTPRPDDDALSWDGDDDPTLDVGAGVDASTDVEASVAAEPEVVPVVLPEGFAPVGKGSESLVHAAAGESVAAEPPAPLGNATLVAVGLFGGVYLLYAIGWLIGGLRLQNGAAFLVSPTGEASPLWAAGNAVALVLAVLAPVIWFVGAFLLARRGSGWMLWVGLAAGALLLVPWPFVMAGVGI